MNAELSQDTVGALVAERPSRSRIFERWGIDYCCGGKRPLAVACAEKSVPLDVVLFELENESSEGSIERSDWTTAPLSELVKYIETTHHAYLREALPRLSMLTEKVRNAHGRRHPELITLTDVFAAFRADMESHTRKEEQEIFPYIEQLDRSEIDAGTNGGSIRNLLQVMEEEHETAGRALETMNRLTHGYTAPEGACATYRAMLDALSELEADTHRHVHKENSILFPRAELREAALS